MKNLHYLNSPAQMKTNFKSTRWIDIKLIRIVSVCSGDVDCPGDYISALYSDYILRKPRQHIAKTSDDLDFLVQNAKWSIVL